MLVDLRASVEAALGRGTPETEGKAQEAESPEPRASAAAAGAGADHNQLAGDVPQQSPAEFAVANSDAPEFEISSAAPEWNPDASESK
jgi:hypothetical protein